MSGKGHSELNYMIEFSEETEGSAEAGETELHFAVNDSCVSFGFGEARQRVRRSACSE
jgi:hypothetical protein